ncbi:MAG: hypothetical protein IBX72_15035 [Nitrospirae bacterium]|nr:hypothetical protein [Nitrospirota bacterium]MDW7728173.1 hypothetical protein [Candidatus Methanoperedens sp.]
MYKINTLWKYLLFPSIGILSFYISGFMLGVLSENGIGIHGLEAIAFMLFTYVILMAAGLVVSLTERRNLGIFVYNSQGRSVKLIYEENKPLEKATLISVSWSPDGS